MKEKEELRKKILAARNLLSPKERGEKSRLIKLRLQKLPEYKAAKTIFCYYSFGSEVETLALIEEAVSQGKIVALPLVLLPEREMLALRIESLNRNLKKGPLGFKMPVERPENQVRPEEIDLVVVPGIAFDAKGYRLGRGAGYYDRFLQKLKAKTPLVALAFEVQIVNKIPFDKHDIKVNKIITESRILACDAKTQ